MRRSIKNPNLYPACLDSMYSIIISLGFLWIGNMLVRWDREMRTVPRPRRRVFPPAPAPPGRPAPPGPHTGPAVRARTHTSLPLSRVSGSLTTVRRNGGWESCGTQRH